MPTLMDNPHKFLLWDIAPSMIVFLFLTFGLLLKETFVFLAVGMGLAYLWQNKAGGKHPWFLLHAGQWYLPFKTKSIRTGSSVDREYLR